MAFKLGGGEAGGQRIPEVPVPLTCGVRGREDPFGRPRSIPWWSWRNDSGTRLRRRCRALAGERIVAICALRYRRRRSIRSADAAVPVSQGME